MILSGDELLKTEASFKGQYDTILVEKRNILSKELLEKLELTSFSKEDMNKKKR